MPEIVNAVEMRGIVKRFPGVLANDHTDFDLRLGEVHALLGENGAGKSTLMNVLAGMYKPEEGSISVGGKRVHFGSPRDAISAGIGMIHEVTEDVGLVAAPGPVGIDRGAELDAGYLAAAVGHMQRKAAHPAEEIPDTVRVELLHPRPPLPVERLGLPVAPLPAWLNLQVERLSQVVTCWFVKTPGLASLLL